MHIHVVKVSYNEIMIANKLRASSLTMGLFGSYVNTYSFYTI